MNTLTLECGHQVDSIDAPTVMLCPFDQSTVMVADVSPVRPPIKQVDDGRVSAAAA